MTDRLSTGVNALDRELGGGVYPGSIVLLTAPPASQSEPLLHALMRRHRTRYVTTRRNERAVAESLDRVFRGGEAEYSVSFAGLDEPLANVREAIALVEDDSAVVVDTVDPLERIGDADRYLTFLNEFKDALLRTDSVGFLHASSSAHRSELRDITESVADVVWKLAVERNGSEVDQLLSVPKFRGGDLPGETIKLVLGRDVRVDTSRDIA